MTDFWNESSTAVKIIIVAVIASVVCGLAVLCVLGLGLLGVFELPGAASPTPQAQATSVTIHRVSGIVVVPATPAAGAPSAAAVCRIDILSGPGTTYEKVGVLEEGQRVAVVGRSEDSQWFVIKIAEGRTTQGWVSVQCLQVENVETAPVVPPPPAPTPTPPPPVVITGWQGEYYANRELQGDPVLVRDDTEIKFDWGTGSPAPEVPSDNFSARWTISRELPAATYRFNIWVDDGVRMWIDDVLIIDGWVEGATRNYIADVNLAAGTHNARVEYFEAVGYATISLDTGVVEPPPPTDGPPKAAISGPTEAQVGQPVVFSARNSSVAPGSHLTTFEWAFDDGTVARGVDVAHIYTNPGDFQVTLKVTDDKERSNTATQAIKINPAPTAPTATPTEGLDAAINAPSDGVVGQPITFDGSGSSGPNPIVSYRWTFGDGSTADAVTVQKTYDAAGVYNVNLTVTDDQGLEDTEGKQITIVEPPPDATDTPTVEPTEQPTAEPTEVPTEEPTPVPTEEPTEVPTEEPTEVPTEEPTAVPTEEPTEQPPTADIQGPTQATVGETVTFDGSGSQAGSSQIASYEWTFGDGGTGSGLTVDYIYNGVGDFTVTLTVTDENGLGDDATQGISVTE